MYAPHAHAAAHVCSPPVPPSQISLCVQELLKQLSGLGKSKQAIQSRVRHLFTQDVLTLIDPLWSSSYTFVGDFPSPSVVDGASMVYFCAEQVGAMCLLPLPSVPLSQPQKPLSTILGNLVLHLAGLSHGPQGKILQAIRPLRWVNGTTDVFLFLLPYLYQNIVCRGNPKAVEYIKQETMHALESTDHALSRIMFATLDTLSQWYRNSTAILSIAATASNRRHVPKVNYEGDYEDKELLGSFLDVSPPPARALTPGPVHPAARGGSVRLPSRRLPPRRAQPGDGYPRARAATQDRGAALVRAGVSGGLRGRSAGAG